MTPVVSTNEPAGAPTAFPTSGPGGAPPPTLPAGPSYSPYAPAPTVAVWMPQGVPVSVDELMEPADADAFAAILSKLYGKPAKAIDVTPQGSDFWVEYGAETRRMFAIQIGTPGTDAASMAANPLLVYAQGYKLLSLRPHGVGYPFSWSLESNGGNPATMLPVPVFQAPPVVTPVADPSTALLKAQTYLSFYNAIPGAAPMKIVPDV